MALVSISFLPLAFRFVPCAFLVLMEPAVSVFDGYGRCEHVSWVGG
jgi:hypothetical protein